MKTWLLVEHTVVGLLACMALLLSCWQMVARYLFPDWVFDWGGEVVVYLMGWAALIMCSSLAAGNRHIRSDFLLKAMKPEMRRWVLVWGAAASLIFTALMVRYGIEVTYNAYMLDKRSLSSLNFPLWMFDAALPCGMGLMTIRYAIRLVELVRFAIEGRDEPALEAGHLRAVDAPSRGQAG